MDEISRRIEAETRDKYSGKVYDPKTITILPSDSSDSYSNELLRIRLDLVRAFATDKRVLDLCCANGLHLLNIAAMIKWGVGIDFSIPFIKEAVNNKEKLSINNVVFACGNARQIPVANSSVDLVYCFSSLYYFPQVNEAITEIHRVLVRGGRCIFDMGNIYSLNAVVCRSYPEIARPQLISLPAMLKMIGASGLNVEQHRSFQILPHWGGRPAWLKPLLSSHLTKMLMHKLKGRMLDEWLSSLPGLRKLAFRQLFVCQKK